MTPSYSCDPSARLLAETVDTKPARAYVWADRAPLAQIDTVLKSGKAPPPRAPRGKLPAKATTERLTFLHPDHLGTPRLGTGTDATAVWRWEGEAFGATLPDEDPDGDGVATTINLRWLGQYFDQETGLFYNWNRYYDPGTGRYVTSDPVGLRGGLNTYAYVNNNPLRWTDPTGLLSSVEAFNHYLGGSGTPLTMQFSEIDTSKVQLREFVQLQALLSGGCRDQVINVNSKSPFGTSGDAALTVGFISLNLKGTLFIHCDCKWEFQGSLSALDDFYNFNASTHRSRTGEILTSIGRAANGTPYVIHIQGTKGMYDDGRVAGTPTCCRP